MKAPLILLLALLVFLPGCTVLRKVYGIPDPAPSSGMSEAELAPIRERSARDTVVIVAGDTAYYAGDAIFLATLNSLGQHGRSEFEKFAPGRAEVVLLYLENSSRDTVNYMVSISNYERDPRDSTQYVNAKPFPVKILNALKQHSPEAIMTQLMRYKVLTPNTLGYNAANLAKAVRAGLFRERPDLDTAFAQMVSDMAADLRAQRAASTPPVTIGSKGKATGSTSSSTRGGIPYSQAVWNKCTRTVRVFVGDSPGYGGGFNMTVSGNSHNASLNGLHSGVKFWIIDESEKPITGIVVSATSKEIIIGADGVTLSQH